ncbi:SDR family NAD(P)-dependent oxidoreductase [Candidatus Oscillochloris fontis]|uniref:SDR family NAD(P)-dependent oxidoreductase n=1 Tax=Candidatus Oscillochloris fontis TaxID=2496868 RepID=UPI00101CE4F0|nr:SDR family oxidoreductase [Candidatus Oscillochloris fontis]
MVRQEHTLLQGKTAVITGSTQGLGLAIARSFAQAGATLVISNHRAEDVQRAEQWLLQQGAQVVGYACDVRMREQVFGLADSAIATYGKIDIWVNNAGVTATQGPTVAVASNEFTRVIETNIFGTYHGSLAALRHMSPRRSGKLINIVGQGDRRPNPYGNAYGASKTWVRTFSLALAAEERANGIGIFTLNPGLLDTELTRQMRVVAGYERRAHAFDTIARLAAAPAEESAQLALWLAGPATDGTTGLTIHAPLWPRLARGLVREGVRLLLRQPVTQHVQYVTLPPEC